MKRHPHPRSVRFLAAGLLALLVTAAPAFAQAPTAPAGDSPLTAAQRDTVVRELIRVLPRRYIFEEVGREAAQKLTERLEGGAYDSLTESWAFAQALTDDLQEATRDRHFRVVLLPPNMGNPEEPPSGPMQHGFRKLEILAGNVGYVRLDGFAPAEVAGEVAASAMRFLSETDALIFDLRYNGGGSPGMVQLLTSYLTPAGVHLNSLVWRGEDGERENQFWTLPYVPGKRRPDIPVYVLISGRTFSAAEEFANNLRELERATLVGETTGGGANPGGMVELGERFAVFLPNGRAVNPISGRNWEGAGVAPHVEVAADDALDKAHLLALDELLQGAGPEATDRLGLARVVAGARIAPHELSAADMERLAGSYGVRSLAVTDGALTYRLQDRPPRRVVAATADRLVVEGVDDIYIQVERRADGEPTALTLVYDDGRRVRAARDDAG